MPGMMDTVLNLGLNQATLHGLIELTGNERFGWDAYRRFIAMFGRIVMDVAPRVVQAPDGTHAEYNRFDDVLDDVKQAHGATSDTDLDVGALKEVVERYQAIILEQTGRAFPEDPQGAARSGHQGRVRLVVRPARPRLPQEPAHRRRPGHGRQRGDDGLRQHGR